MAERYFLVTALGGRLYIDGISAREPWDPRRLPYQEESVVEVLVGRVGQRKVETVEELRAILIESEKGLLAIRVWVAEGLGEAVHYLD